MHQTTLDSAACVDLAEAYHTIVLSTYQSRLAAFENGELGMFPRMEQDQQPFKELVEVREETLKLPEPPPLLKLALNWKLEEPEIRMLEVLVAAELTPENKSSGHRWNVALTLAGLTHDDMACTLGPASTLRQQGLVQRHTQHYRIVPEVARLLLGSELSDKERSLVSKSNLAFLLEETCIGEATDTVITEPDQPVPIPYLDDLDYLQEEAGRLRLLAERYDNIRTRESEFDRDSPRILRRKEMLEQIETELVRRQTWCQARLAATLENGSWVPRIEGLVQRLKLNWFERDMLLYLTTSHADTSLASRRSIAESVDDILGLLCAGDLRSHIQYRSVFYRNAPLIQEGIIEVDMRNSNLGDADILIDPRMLDHLLGLDTEAGHLVAGSHLYEPEVQLDDVALPADLKKQVVQAVEHFEAFCSARQTLGLDERLPYGRGLVFLFYGPSGTGKTMLANALARHANKRLMLVNSGPGFLEDSERKLRFLIREARLQNAVLFFDECEDFFHEYRSELLTEIERHDGLIILATNKPEMLHQAMHRRITLAIPFRRPDAHLRRQIWESMLPEAVAKDVDVDALAERFRLTGGLIKNAVLAAVATAVARDGKTPIIQQKDLEAGARAQLNGHLRLEALEQRIIPQRNLETLVFEPALEQSLHEILAMETSRQVLHSHWGFGENGGQQGRGMVCLFHGPPGTGKTAAAEALAGELTRPLRLITAAEVLDKYIGETSKRLRTIFEEARAVDAVLVIDEADALLAGRTVVTSSTDRYANADVNVLLHLLEHHEGLVILTTNLEAQLDHALRRRLGFVLRFDRPGPDIRAQMWRKLLPDACPVDESVNLDELASTYELSGAEIRSAVFHAAGRAVTRSESERYLTQQDLCRAAETVGAQNKSRTIGFN